MEADATTTDESSDHEVVDDDEVIVLSWWQNPVNVIALILSTLLIGGLVGWMIARGGEDVADDDVSVGFLHDMRVHHDQAVAMSFMYLDRPDTEPQLRTVARTIVASQSIDIGRMIQLLRDAGQDEASSDGVAMDWMGMGMDETAMPGLASEDQLDRLAAATGAEADALFAELMITHHEGGIDMADYAADNAGSDEVRRMAAAMAAGQQGEIAEIEGLLD